jgi:hypothetical protein
VVIPTTTRPSSAAGPTIRQPESVGACTDRGHARMGRGRACMGRGRACMGRGRACTERGHA